MEKIPPNCTYLLETYALLEQGKSQCNVADHEVTVLSFETPLLSTHCREQDEKFFAKLLHWTTPFYITAAWN